MHTNKRPELIPGPNLTLGPELIVGPRVEPGPGGTLAGWNTGRVRHIKIICLECIFICIGWYPRAPRTTEQSCRIHFVRVFKRFPRQFANETAITK